jgi:hypothetical protein
LQPKSIPPAFRRRLVALAAVWIAAGAHAQLQQPAPLLSRAGWTEAPAYVTLFAPASAREAYRAYVVRAPLEAALKRLADEPSLGRPPGAWQPSSLGPLDAFGQGGSYNRWALARLYGATPVRVAHGPRVQDGRTVESWTLLSPYPDATLHRLEPGTLLLVTRVRSL